MEECDRKVAVIFAEWLEMRSAGLLEVRLKSHTNTHTHTNTHAPVGLIMVYRTLKYTVNQNVVQKKCIFTHVASYKTVFFNHVQDKQYTYCQPFC